MNEDVEQALVDLAADRHDEAAWRTIYKKLRPLVYAQAFRSTRGREDEARDVVQNVFIRLIKYCRFEEFDDEVSFRNYLHVVTRHAVQRFSERQARDVAEGQGISLESLSDSEIAGIDDGVSQADESILIQDLLRRALADSSRQDRIALSLQLSGYSLREIASRIGGSSGAVGVRLHRLKARLREHRLLRNLL